MSDENDQRLDLTQRTNIELAPEGGLLGGFVGEERVMVWRRGRRLKAYGANCSHLGAPLDRGVVDAGIVRCPWHHACFDLESGAATWRSGFRRSDGISGCRGSG